MKFYLSSFRIGENGESLKAVAKEGKKKVAFILNAVDYLKDLEFKKKILHDDISDLENLGFNVEILDLKDYFSHKERLQSKVKEFDMLWCCGGNAFVLRQAMFLSGFDKLLKQLYESNEDIIYGGYSAGVSLLGPTLKGTHLSDDPNEKPYGYENETIWEGLGITNYVIVPHYQSAHSESDSMNEVITYLIQNKVLFIALKDGEVIEFNQ